MADKKEIERILAKTDLNFACWLYKDGDAKVFEPNEIEAAVHGGWLDYPVAAPAVEEEAPKKRRGRPPKVADEPEAVQEDPAAEPQE